MSIIYEPKGKAKEYGALAANLYRGCDHGCTYCYAPSCLRLNKENFISASPRKDIIKNIIKEAPKYQGQEVFLCFTCDPYQKIDEEYKTTRKTLEIFYNYGIKPVILTKGGKRSLRDIDLFSDCDNTKYGVTLTTSNDIDSKLHEPGASVSSERINVLEEIYNRGIYTWVSFEPVIDTVQTLELIKLTANFTNFVKVGKLNHKNNSTDWGKFAKEAKALLDSLGKKYYIKQDLQKFL